MTLLLSIATGESLLCPASPEPTDWRKYTGQDAGEPEREALRAKGSGGPQGSGGCQAPLSIGFSRQEYCSGLLCPPPGRGFSLSVAPVFGFSRGMTGSSGSLLCGAREVRADRKSVV